MGRVAAESITRDDRLLSRLGTPFFRGELARREERPGVGLGLTVARQIVTAQRAVLRFEGGPGEGLTARIVF